MQKGGGLMARKKFLSKRELLFMSCGGICPECGKQMQISNSRAMDTYMTVDHIVPKLKGGTNNIENLRPMCRKCNMERGNEDVTGYMFYLNVNSEYHAVKIG